MSEPWYQRVQREAAEKVKALLARPISNDYQAQDTDKDFDPWSIFNCVYGSYSSDFDETAIQVLEDFGKKDFNKTRSTLAHEMIREMFCVADLCEYGTSPRCCWPTEEFEPLVPTLLDKWKQYYLMQWGEAYPA